MKNENYNDFEDVMEGLMGFLEELPQATVKILNFDRYKLMLQTAAKLTNLLRENLTDGEISIEINEKFNLGTISVEMETFTITSSAVFADLICKADNFEVYPLCNGNIRLDITFQRVLNSVI